MATQLEETRCPRCQSGQVYILVGGKIVCRKCGFDARKFEHIVNETK